MSVLPSEPVEPPVDPALDPEPHAADAAPSEDAGPETVIDLRADTDTDAAVDAVPDDHEVVADELRAGLDAIDAALRAIEDGRRPSEVIAELIAPLPEG